MNTPSTSTAAPIVQPKFRPSLSLAEIQYIVGLIKSSPPSTIGISLTRSLERMILKAKYGIVGPSHVSIQESIEQELGFSPKESSDELLQELMLIYDSTPSALSDKQISEIKRYRYLNDMMTPEEEASYEANGE